jgi:hypothetical protein
MTKVFGSVLTAASRSTATATLTACRLWVSASYTASRRCLVTRPLGLWYLLHDDWLVCDEAFLIFIMVYEAVGLYTSGAGCVQSPSCLPSGFYWNDPTIVPHPVISRVLFSKHPTPPRVVHWRTNSEDSLSATGHRRGLEHGPRLTV